MILVAALEKGVFTTLEKGLMGMHPAAVLAEDGFGHERGVDAILPGNFLDRGAIGHYLIGHFQGFVIAEIDFMLARGGFVGGIFYADTHVLKGEYGLASWIRAAIHGKAIKVTAPVQNLRRAVIGKIEIFQFRPHVKNVAHIIYLF